MQLDYLKEYSRWLLATGNLRLASDNYQPTTIFFFLKKKASLLH
jgi:hypothetical protein